MTLEQGSTIIIDGKALTVATITGTTARATDEQGRAVFFDAREAKYLGAGLHGLPGRIEPPTEVPGAVVANVAIATGG